MSTASASAATLTSSVDSAATAADGEKPTHRRTSSHPAESPGGPSHKPAKHKVRHRKVKQGETIFKKHIAEARKLIEILGRHKEPEEVSDTVHELKKATKFKK